MPERPPQLQVEIVAYAPTAFFHCQHCELVWQQTGFGAGLRQEQVRSALPPDLQADYQAVSDWVRHLLQAFCGQVAVNVIDAASLEGFWKTARHGLRRYPAVIVDGRSRFIGPGFAQAEDEIRRRLAAGAEREVVAPQH